MSSIARLSRPLSIQMKPDLRSSISRPHLHQTLEYLIQKRSAEQWRSAYLIGLVCKLYIQKLRTTLRPWISYEYKWVWEDGSDTVQIIINAWDRRATADFLYALCWQWSIYSIMKINFRVNIYLKSWGVIFQRLNRYKTLVSEPKATTEK